MVDEAKTFQLTSIPQCEMQLYLLYIKIFQCLYILREAGYLFLSANIYERSKLCADIYSYSGRLQSSSLSQHSPIYISFQIE